MRCLAATALLACAVVHHGAQVVVADTSNEVAAVAVDRDSGSKRAFAYHHAEGQRSQKGHHSPHSASQIAFPEAPRFASQHTSITSSASSTASTAASATQQLAAAAHALARAANTATAKVVAGTAVDASKAHARHSASSKAQSKSKSKAAKSHKAVPGGGSAEPGGRVTRADGYPGDATVATAKLSSPIYGSYTRNYGSVSQPLAEGSGYGGFTGNVDPTGFNFQHDDVTPTGGQRGWGASTLSGQPFGSAYPCLLYTSPSPRDRG